MNDGIKEILENIKCPQLGYDEYGKWGALPLNVRMTLKRLCDYVVSCDYYITNLQQIEQKHKKINGELREENSKLEIALQNIQEDYNKRIKEIDVLKKKLDRRYYKNECKRLEQENERLKEENNNKAMNDYAHAIDESWYRELYDDYKSRCEKAIEYVNKEFKDEPYSVFIYGKTNIDNLLNILQNGSEKNEC